MKPFYARVGSFIYDVVPLPNDELAVLTPQGVTVLDRALAKVAEAPYAGDPPTGADLIVLNDGRFVVYRDGDLSRPYIGTRGSTIGPLDPGPDAAHYNGVAATSVGFLAVGWQKLFVEAEGMRQTMDLSKSFFPKRVFPWQDGALVTSSDGFMTFDARGGSRGEVKCKLEDAVLIGDRLVSRGDERVACFGMDGNELWSWGPEASDEKKPLLMAPQIAGEQIVIGAYDVPKAWILDAEGKLVREVALPKPLRSAARFGEEIAFACSESREVIAGESTLEHDSSPLVVASLPGGALATTERDLLFVWRPGEDGPAPPPLVSPLPIGVPIVVGGGRVVVTGPGLFAMRGMAGTTPVRIEPNEPFRLATTRAEAVAIVERLMARKFDGPLPNKLDSSGVGHEYGARIAQLPLRESVELQGRALFAASTLAEQEQVAASFSRSSFLAELGEALELSPRRVYASIRSRKFPLDPPRPVEGYEYLGMFTSEGRLLISDPCYMKRAVPKAGFALNVEVEAMRGNWYAFVRPSNDRTGELVAIHEQGFDVIANEQVGSIGVDSGTALICDKSCPRPPEGAIDEGVVSGLGVMSSTGQGDGFYGVFVGKKASVVKARVYFMGEDPAELDATVGKRAIAETRKYLATERYALGDAIEHKKFGAGVVTRLLGDKIEVSFKGESRTLVHGLKV